MFSEVVCDPRASGVDMALRMEGDHSRTMAIANNTTVIDVFYKKVSLPLKEARTYCK